MRVAGRLIAGRVASRPGRTVVQGGVLVQHVLQSTTRYAARDVQAEGGPAEAEDGQQRTQGGGRAA